ncbi:Competence protein [[Clostridium] ultunense Esp]|uniref:Competence protein n=1 Tax=[Clostridium] ultunense Esp TaxID=1288971 RepID=M1Z4E5_9FIRM|nr:helix-hairpin-helix domain-containing protein [Schnuerera ultunensis]CCQ92629.1 Competence protein [[Clostridium] ultunense Esp]SHD77923.1 Competence protein [[Clostridium] ultunense Esp]
MSYFTKKEQILIIIIIIIIFIISGFNFINKNFLSTKNDHNENTDGVEELFMKLEEEAETNEDEQYIMVHVSGQVYNPGIVELKLGSRVIDAINLAGGLKKDADSDKINLARKLSDEEKIHIPKIGEEEISFEDSNLKQGNNEGKININTCTKEELMSLPGIGEVLAGRILEYREQTPFKTIEDIMNVSGIGNKKFESIKELIIVK